MKMAASSILNEKIMNILVTRHLGIQIASVSVNNHAGINRSERGLTMSGRMKTYILWVFLAAVFLSLSSCSAGVGTQEVSETSPAIIQSPAATNTTIIASDTNTPTSAPTQTNPPPAVEPSAVPSATESISVLAPEVIPPTGPVMAFLKEGDIWLVDEPGGSSYPLTVAGDILSFTWASNGERLAAFNGHTLCFYHRDGSVRTACLDLGLDDTQAKIERRLVLSPDQRWIVLWNPVNPQDEAAIGWMIVALDSSNIMYRISDPVEWGAALTPEGEAGGFTGMPIFLPDGRLIGTLAHRSMCAASGCHYQLFQFDLESRVFIAFDNSPSEGFSEGQGLQISQDGRILSNFGTFYNDCESFVTFVDLYTLVDGQREVFNLDQVAVAQLAFAPDVKTAMIASTSACSSPDTSTWADTCGLIDSFEVKPLQSWNIDTGERKDLLPGLGPIFSPDGKWLVFSSCLSQIEPGKWEPSETAKAGLYLLNLDQQQVLEIGEGVLPEWQP